MPQLLKHIAAAGSLLVGVAMMLAVPAYAQDAPAPVIDTRIVTASSLKSVTDYFASKAVSFRRTAASSNNPLLIEKDEAFRVSFFCSVGEQACKGQAYNTLIMWACDAAAASRTVERANSVNLGKVFGRSYIDGEGKACVEQEVVTGVGGVSYEVMDVYYAGFTDMRGRLPQYYQ